MESALLTTVVYVDLGLMLSPKPQATAQLKDQAFSTCIAAAVASQFVTCDAPANRHG